MDISALGELMVEHGACIRAIPKVERSIVEPRHIKEHPDGKLVFLPEYNREMLVYERIPKHAGQFLLKTGLSTSARVDFNSERFYDTIEDAAEALLELHAVETASCDAVLRVLGGKGC